MEKELNFLMELITTILYNKPSPSVQKKFDCNTFVNHVLQNEFNSLVYARMKDMSEVPEEVRLALKYSEVNSDMVSKGKAVFGAFFLDYKTMAFS